MARGGAAVVALALLALVTVPGGCGHDAETPRYDSYVALGDSFTSGAGLPQPKPGATACGQSTLSYPHLVAKAVGAELHDVSCGGASSDNGSQPQALGQTTWPPQLDALTRDTDLVTVGLGANDFGCNSGLLCAGTWPAPADPTGTPCQAQASAAGSDLTELPARIGARLASLLAEVHRRAPDARVLLVGYPQPVPAHGTCAGLPLATGDYPFVRAQWEALDAAMRRAAATTKTTYVSVLGPSEGHDICAGADAWVNGVPQRAGVAAVYHPLEEGQTAMARLVEQALRE
jgi:lysophospholipase L1-like esterase